MNDDITALIHPENEPVQAVVSTENLTTAVIDPVVLIPQDETTLPDILLIYQIAKS